MVLPVLKKIAYLPHDGSPGVTFPDIYWDPNTGDIYFGHDGNINVHINGMLANRSRAQMTNCGTQNLKNKTEQVPLGLPFAESVSDNPPFLLDFQSYPGVVQVLQEGFYLLSYNLPFEIDSGLLIACSAGACWQWSPNPTGPWADISQTKSFDTAHSEIDDHGAINLPPVEIMIGAGLFLRVAAFEIGTPGVDCYINSNDNNGGPFDWAWARIEAFRVIPVAPPPPPVR